MEKTDQTLLVQTAQSAADSYVRCEAALERAAREDDITLSVSDGTIIDRPDPRRRW